MSKSLRKAAKELLDEGLTKEAALAQLLVDFDRIYNRMEIAKVLRYLPSKEQKRQYGIYNTLMLSLLIIIDLSNLVILNYGGLIWFGLLTYLVISQKTKYYYWISVWGALIIVMGIAMSFYGGVVASWGISSLWFILASTILGGIFIAFGYLFPKYYTPEYDASGNEEFTDAEGNIQLRKKINFG
jgi:hypothetical protein